VLPHSVIAVGDRPFYGCTWLVVVRLLRRHPIQGARDMFTGCNHLSLVVAPRVSELVGTTFSACPLLGGAGVVEDTAANRRRALDLQYWSVRTHQLCSAPHRKWVQTVLLVANRLRGGALALPHELWYTILECIRRCELGRVECQDPEAVTTPSGADLRWGCRGRSGELPKWYDLLNQMMGIENHLA
jgi:hypothetical protein